MARMYHAGEFATEGEQRAAEALRALPDSWVVICNKTLVTQNGRSFEIDFLVLGDHFVFAIDEKSWRGRVHGSDQVWVRTDGSSERSPLTKIEYVANVLAGELRDRVSRLQAVRDHFVYSAVLLSAAEELPRVRDSRTGDHVFLLEGVVDRLVAIDAPAPHEPISPFRPSIETALLDLRDRPRFPRRIGDYQVEEILSSRPGCYVARATHDLAGPRTLAVYNLAGATADARNFYLRAFEAVQKLHATRLAAEVLDPFVWSDDFLVVPFAPPPGKALATLKSPQGIEDLEAELSLAALAFEALTEMHGHAVVHRALSPDTIYVQGSVREPKGLVFTGFYAARLDRQRTVAAQLDEMAISDPYAAPELALSYGLADVDSDVYSLALVFFERLSGLRVDDLRTPQGARVPREHLAARWSQLPSGVLDTIAELFRQALGPGRMASPDDLTAQRPAPAACAARLRSVVRELHTTAAEAGGLLDGRYRVRRKLGEGFSGRTYLVEDEEIDEFLPRTDEFLPRTFVVKAFHQPEAVRQQAGREFVALQRVSSPHFPRIYDFYPPNHDVHLKMDYVPGPTLAEVQKEFPWDEARWWRFADGLLSALEVLEKDNLRHRDLKPSNIILRTGDDAPVLVDFGFVVRAHVPAPPAGSIGYLPPEAPLAPQPPDSIDRYAAAVILHEALTACRPDADPPAGSLSERVKRLREVLLRAASSHPAERPRSAAEFRQALEAARRVLDEPPVVRVGSKLLRQINPWVDAVRGLYRDAATGNADNRGLDSQFARDTYVPTALDEHLLPAILRHRPPAVFLSGNPGDGKTAFLEQLRDELAARGAARREQDPSGWEWELDGHTFRSCYDASESHGQLSADAQLNRRLEGLEGIRRSVHPLTVLVAINDGRLADFFHRRDETFPWLADRIKDAAQDGAAGPGEPWVIDLKRRAFIHLAQGPGQPSVFQRVLDTLVAPEHWVACGTCQAQAVCPIAANTSALAGERDGGRARQRLERLAALVHLRHDFHATMRDLRSTLAYLVTANLTCERVHRAREGDAPATVLGADSRFWQRAFTPPPGGDELLLGMAHLDPGRLPRPRLDRFLALHDQPDDIASVAALFPQDDATAAAEVASVHYPGQAGWLAAVKRRLYFCAEALELDGAPVAPPGLLPYRYADRFLAALRGEADLDALRLDLARGITRSDGIAAQVLGASLCVRVQHNEAQQLTVLKRFPVEDFTLRIVRPPRAALVETVPEALELAYRGGTPALVIELDIFELLLRFADGLRPSAPEYRPLLEDLAPFKNSLILASTHELVLLEAERRIHRITQRNGKIVRLAVGG